MRTRSVLLSFLLCLSLLTSFATAEPDEISKGLVGIVGGGPAGMTLARALSDEGVEVVIFNQDPSPGGLVKYGFYYTKEQSKGSLLGRYQETLDRPTVDYHGGVRVAGDGTLNIDDLNAMGFDALVFTNGADGIKRLGIVNEDRVVYSHEVFRYYNGHPDYKDKPPELGRKIALIGAGNSVLDVARYLLAQDRNVELTLLIRRGPNDFKWQATHFMHIEPFLDRAAIAKEVERITPLLQAQGQSPAKFVSEYLEHYPNVEGPAGSSGKVTLRFFVSPTELLLDAEGKVAGLKVKHNGGGGETSETLAVDTVIPVIGAAADTTLGLALDKQGRYRTVNETDAITHDMDRKKSEYYPTLTLDHYRIAANEKGPEKYVAGWARIPGVGKALRNGESLNVEDDAARLAELLLEKLRKQLTRPRAVTKALREAIDTRCGTALGKLASS